MKTQGRLKLGAIALGALAAAAFPAYAHDDLPGLKEMARTGYR